jgi:hypothetical protein
MGLYKFEQDIKEKLEKRTLQPSENAWDKLEHKFTSKKTNKNLKAYWILGIAASIIGILLIIPLFLNNDIKKSSPIIVDTKPIKKIENKTLIHEVQTVVVEKNQHETKILGNPVIVSKPIKQPFNNSKNQFDIAKNNVVKVLQSKNETLTKVAVTQADFNSSQASIISNKAIQKQDYKQSNYTITDSEIDLLLNQAQKKLALQTIYTEESKSVDANKLLQDVEAELDKSFRNKVFKTLKINYENMKITIAQRNN